MIILYLFHTYSMIIPYLFYGHSMELSYLELEAIDYILWNGGIRK